MPRKMSDLGTMSEKIMKSGGDSGEVRKSEQAPEKGLGKYRKRLYSGEYRKCGIRASIENVGSGRVPKMWDPGEYQKCGIRASTENVGSRQVPKRWDSSKYQKGGIRASTRKGRIRASTGEGSG